jgi:uracil-DNA glycosylase
MNHTLLKSNLKQEIIPILKKIIKLDDNEIESIYTEIVESKDENFWCKEMDSENLCNNLQNYKDCLALGIDFPIWFDWDDINKPKVMIIGRDPQRNHDDNRLVIGTPFGLGTEGGRNSKRNKYWKFTKLLLQQNRVYLTDVYKLFTKSNEKKELKKDTKFHYEILEKEIKTVNPDKIVTIGKDAKIAISSMYKIDHNNCINSHTVEPNNLEIIFVPHISNMVLQNIIPIANLFLSLGKIKNDKNLEKIGCDILENKNNLFEK